MKVLLLFSLFIVTSSLSNYQDLAGKLEELVEKFERECADTPEECDLELKLIQIIIKDDVNESRKENLAVKLMNPLNNVGLNQKRDVAKGKLAKEKKFIIDEVKTFFDGNEDKIMAMWRMFMKLLNDSSFIDGTDTYRKEAIRSVAKAA